MEILDFLKQHQFSVPTLRFDGTPIRFDRAGVNTGWFIGTKHSIGKHTVVFATFGDWKTGEKYEYKTKVDFTTEEFAESQKYMEELRAKQIEAQEKKAETQEEAAEKAFAEWQTFDLTGTHPYLEKKQLPRLFGARIHKSDVFSPELCIPGYDIEGKFVGYQRIFPDGGKFFYKGMRSKGAMHTIGEIPEEGGLVYVAEGFATAASIHLATKKCTVVSFNSGNLETVVRHFSRRWPNRRVVVCGDEDLFSVDSKGAPINPGRQAAEAAAQAIQAMVWFPRFSEASLQLKDEKGKPLKITDANDLHCLEGLDTLRAQLEAVDQQARPEEGATGPGIGEYVTALGFNGDTYYYTSSSNPQINALRDHSETDIYKLMPRQYWLDTYGYTQEIAKGRGKEKIITEVQKIDWNEVKSDLMAKCRGEGFFENKRIRGAGVWMDRGKVVVHLGDRLFYDGADHPLRSLKTDYIYELGRKLKPVHPTPLGLEEVGPLLRVLDLLNYDRPEQKFFLGGWLAIAPICGLLHWRAHLWVSGEQGSGKSTVMSEIVIPIMGAFSKLYVQGATTEAGIRQSIKACAIPIVFDEFEGTDPRTDNRVQSVIELFRQASSEHGGAIAKGSAHGEATEYHARFCGIVSSVQAKLTNGADKSRFTLIELKKILADSGQWEKFQAAVFNLTPEFCERLFSRMVKMVPIYLENQKKFQKVFALKHSNRFGQQYGTLLAGWAALISDAVLEESEIEKWVSQVSLDQEMASGDSTDQEECLHHLLSKQVRIVDEVISLEEQLLSIQKDPSLEEGVFSKLAKLGIYRLHNKERGPGVLILNQHPELRLIFKDTRWTTSWAQTLARIPGALPKQKSKFNGKTTPRGVFVPQVKILGDVDKEATRY